MNDIDPFTIIGIDETPTPAADEAEHFMACPFCGQAFDCRSLGEVFHHMDDDGHEPIERPLA